MNSSHNRSPIPEIEKGTPHKRAVTLLTPCAGRLFQDHHAGFWRTLPYLNVAIQIHGVKKSEESDFHGANYELLLMLTFTRRSRHAA
jgi:hypothetical protein